MEKITETREEKNDSLSVPYIAHEGDMARQERTIKRLWISGLVAIILLVITNAAWIWYESQWQAVETTTTQEVTQDAENGTNNFAGGDLNGTPDSKNIDNNTD